MIRQIDYQGEPLALVVFHSLQPDGVRFLTPDDSSLQLAYISHPTGKSIAPHLHNEVRREITRTQECFVIKKGKVRVDFFNNAKQHVESQILTAGDVLLQISGGHGFEVLENLEMIEVKQGPYMGLDDKTYFAADVGLEKISA
jgi:mannose-6-phosphate isomerase-like protein (cupin superfamily)